ncbi:choice-of-anchor L domain-containing protein [Flavobacterium sp.]|uniref:T9SS type B sorting domain-containing protein n=1 Tax=Flavobacterium sp. TaxID=239 RepID=UPI003752C2A8
MKKTLSLLFILLTVNVFSQAITVSTNTYTVPQLVNSVLINSPCINATNITWRTGTNFGSTNGIGYFQNTNPNFPMQSGVVLSTGNALEAAGPNTTFLSSGTTAWTGDAALEATLATSGITMTSANATVLEFEFTPLSPHFDFDFLFASEEYGNFQCQFSDAFAFLLTNMSTGITTNLAVVPGTSSPISVVTIRDFLYNSTCPSANQNFFGSFNGGSNATNSATNFNGQTKVMNASATLVPNTLYKIKLVIADRSDNKSDSAIFLSSNSFNIGQKVLGDDLTIATNTAICDGQTHVINSGLNPAIYSFIWKKDGAIINGQNGASLTISQPGVYEITYTNIAFPCQTITDSILVEYYPIFSTPNPTNLYKCNTGQPNYNFNLAYNTPLVTSGLDASTTVSYHASIIDANSNSNALPLNYLSAGNQTIFVRINNPATGCYTIKSFQLLVVTSPIANQPADLTLCGNNAGTGNFNLNFTTSSILNGQSPLIYTVLYFYTMADANANTNATNGQVIVSNPNQTVYIRVHLITDSSCYSITSMNLHLLPLPLVDKLDDVITCTSYILPPLTNGNYFTGSGGTGTPLFAGDVITQTKLIYIYNISNSTPACPNETSFKVVIIKPEDLSITSGTYCNNYTLPSLQYGEYHTQPDGAGTNLPGGTVLTTSQTIYYYFLSDETPPCVVQAPFSIVIVTSQDVPTFSNVFDCTSYTLQPLSFGNYYDGPNGTGNQLPVGTVINASKRIYIYGQTGTACNSQSTFEVVIGINFPTSVTECVSYTLPQLIVGNYFTGPIGSGTQIAAGTVINSTQTIYVYAISQSQPNCTDNYNFIVSIVLPVITPPTVLSGCDNYTLPALTTGNYFTASGGGGTALFATDVITSSQKLYIYVNDNNGCQNEISIDIVINQTPIIDSRAEIDACHSYTLTNLSQGNYFTGPNGSGTMMNGGDVLTDSQLIYIYATANGCSAETSFQLNIFKIVAFQPQNIAICDNYTLPTLPVDNKYYTQTGGQYGTGTELPSGTILNTSQTVYVFIESAGRINCTNETSFTITIIPTPVIPNPANVAVCNSYTLPALSVGDYYTQTNKGGIKLNAGTVITTSQTLFIYAETATTPNCFDEKSFTIAIFNVDQLQDITICESYTLPNLTIGNYYNATGGTGGMILQGSTIYASKTVYIFANSGYNPNCSDETSFVVTIIDTPIANPVPLAVRTICDQDGINDGIFNFDLTTFNSIILGTQTGPEFSLNYYSTLNDATANSNSIINSTLTTVYVRVNNALAPNCYDVKPISIIVNKIPEPKPIDGIICIKSSNGQLLNPYMLYSGLPSNTHTFQWFNAQGQVVGTGANYQAILPGTYSIIATSTITGCPSEEVFTIVSPSEPALVSYAVSADFADSQSITITATGTGGDYEYQLDNGVFQDSPVFNNVMSGLHTITVRDKNGCGITITDAIVVNYPHYFTPNGDGINETWNIKDLQEQEVSTIYIYDRYGKLIRKIKPSGIGWDGTYNNTLMPADDYWFSINYLKDGTEKEFKAHFALKR